MPTTTTQQHQATHKAKNGNRTDTTLTVTTKVQTVQHNGKTYIPTGETAEYTTGDGQTVWILNEFQSIPTGERGWKPHRIYINEVFSFVAEAGAKLAYRD